MSMESCIPVYLWKLIRWKKKQFICINLTRPMPMSFSRVPVKKLFMGYENHAIIINKNSWVSWTSSSHLSCTWISRIPHVHLLCAYSDTVWAGSHSAGHNDSWRIYILTHDMVTLWVVLLVSLQNPFCVVCIWKNTYFCKFLISVSSIYYDKSWLKLPQHTSSSNHQQLFPWSLHL